MGLSDLGHALGDALLDGGADGLEGRGDLGGPHLQRHLGARAHPPLKGGEGG